MLGMDGRLRRYVEVLLMLALAAIVSGAIITSNRNAEQRGQLEVSGAGRAATPYDAVHIAVSIVAGVLTLGLAVWPGKTKASRSLQVLAWISASALLIVAASGWLSAPASPLNGFLHACCAQAFLAVLSAIAVLTSRGWNRGTEPVADRGWTALRPLATATPLAVFVQIILGAAYRHQLLGVITHIAGALVVVLLALIGSVIVLQHFPEHLALRRAAIALISSVVTQVCLGIPALVVPLLGSGGVTLALLTAAHVFVGAMTLASSIAMAMVIRRNILPRTQPQTGR